MTIRTTNHAADRLPATEHRRRRRASTNATRPSRRAETARPPPRRCQRVLDHASAEELSMTAALERLLAIEVDATEARRLAGRLRFACLPTPASFEDFDYDAAAGVDRKLIEELATCRYLETATNVLLIGPPGVGKTHLVRRPRPGPQQMPDTAPTSPPPPTSPPAATAPRSKDGGPPPCGSSPARRCW